VSRAFLLARDTSRGLLPHVWRVRAAYAEIGIVQSSFRPASRRETLGRHSEGGRRDGGLKLLCTIPGSGLSRVIVFPGSVSKDIGNGYSA
jgi:hypothetical protein